MFEFHPFKSSVNAQTAMKKSAIFGNSSICIVHKFNFDGFLRADNKSKNQCFTLSLDMTYLEYGDLFPVQFFQCKTLVASIEPAIKPASSESVVVSLVLPGATICLPISKPANRTLALGTEKNRRGDRPL